VHKRPVRQTLAELITRRTLIFGTHIVQAIISSLADAFEIVHQKKYLILTLPLELISVGDTLEEVYIHINGVYTTEDPRDFIPISVGLTAPELYNITTAKPSESADIYILGIITYYLVARAKVIQMRY